MKDKGRSLVDLGISFDSSPPTTLSLLPGLDLSEDRSPVESPDENAPLTIFYGGKVFVFDNFSACKADDLIQLAVKSGGTEDRKTAVVSNLPMARKASLHRFLEKRKDRINARAPYRVKDSPVESAKLEEGRPWLCLSVENCR